MLSCRLGKSLGGISVCLAVASVALPDRFPFGATPSYAQNTSSCFGQPVTSLNLQNPTQLTGGSPVALNARHRYFDVAGDGNIDAIIEIVGFANGASLNVFDNDAAGQGIQVNFQPELNATLNQDSGVDFRIDFVANGTASDPVFLDIAINSIDVDGNGTPPGGDLREYVEYETTLNTFVLNNPTALSVNASGPSAGNRIRFESTTTQFAPGIDPTALQNIVAGLYTNISGFGFRIGALQAGATGGGANTRLTSLGFSCPDQQFQDNGDETPQSNPAIQVTKAADLTVNVPAGQDVVYTYEVTNTGDVTLDNVQLNDIHGGTGTFPDPASETLITDTAPVGDSVDATASDGIWDRLAPGDVIRFTSTYTVTQQDIDTLQ